MDFLSQVRYELLLDSVIFVLSQTWILFVSNIKYFKKICFYYQLHDLLFSTGELRCE